MSSFAPPMSFAAQLKTQRASLGLTQAEAAASISPYRDIVRTLENWEAGRNAPPDWAQPLIIASIRKRRAKGSNA